MHAASRLPGSYALALLMLSGLLLAAGNDPAGPTAPVVRTSSPAGPALTAGDPWPGTGAWAKRQLRAMSMRQKVSQLFFVRAFGRYASADDPEYEELQRLVEDFGVGGIIMFQGNPMEQATMLNELQGLARLPLLVSQDMEWGAGMRIEGATSFPRAMAVGATRNAEYARAAGYVTAREARALGTHWVYAPVADVNNNPDNPVINVRSFGEDPRLVGRMVAASIRGLRDGQAISTVKHFPGHGDTNVDSHIGMPSLPFTRARLDTLELVPFRSALAAGVQGVMTAHLALPALTDGDLPASLSPAVTEQLLRSELNFDGIVVTDALDMGGVTTHYDPGEAALRALEAGADALLLSTDPYAARTAIMDAVRGGRLSRERIDRSVLRLLQAKEWAGLPATRTVDLVALRHHVATREHQALGEAIARDALTLLANRDEVLPFQSDTLRLLSIALTDNEDAEAGSYFAGQLRRHHPDSLVQSFTLDQRSTDAQYEAMRQAADTADVVVLPTFVSVRSWSGKINLSDQHRTFVQSLTERDVPVVLLAFGNPYLVRGIAPLPAVYLAAYGSTPLIQRVTAEALFGKATIDGRLPVTIPGTFAFGAGMRLPQVAPRHGAPETVGLHSAQLDRVDSLLHAAIEDRAFPGAAVSVSRGGVVAKQEGYGYFTYSAHQPVTAHTPFDLASLTKVVATTTAMMKLYEAGQIDLDAPVTRYLPAFAQNGKDAVTVRHLLTHSSGLIPYRRYHEDATVTSRQDVLDAILAEPLQFEPGTETAYSDLGFITLMRIIEQVSGQPFDVYCREHIFGPLGMTQTGFRPVVSTLHPQRGHPAVPDSLVVPTEVDRTFRRRLVQGMVHDETAFLMGGVSGHAGLFSTAHDLSTFAYMLAHEGRIHGQPFLKPETIRLFTREGGLGDAGTTRTLGWDTRSTEGYSSAGQLFGPHSFGHTGFTGTSLWIDPDQQLAVVLLTNRVHPTRENRKISGVRPRLADIAYRAIGGPVAPLLPGVQAGSPMSSAH